MHLELTQRFCSLIEAPDMSFKMSQEYLILMVTTVLFVTPTRGEIPFSDFEKGLGDFARTSEGLQPCLRIEDPGLRSRCSLLAALEAEAAAAAGGGGGGEQPITSNESCTYRIQGGSSLHRYADRPPPFLKRVLERYATLHRRCVGLEYERLGRLYRKKRRPECRYVVWSCTFGLGNKLMSLVSTFLYAILSQRVLLIESPGWEHLFCEPFPGSKLQVPEDFSLRDDFAPSAAATPDPGRHYTLELAFTGASTARDHALLVCPTAASPLRAVPFLHFRNSNQHFLTGLFLNPALRPLLEPLFPSRNPFHLLARAFLAPSNPVWTQIREFHARHLLPAARSVGVQLRESKGEYRAYYDEVVPLCWKRTAGMCPVELEEAERQGNASSRAVVSVFVASLAAGHFERLRESVPKLEAEMRQRFVVVAQDSDGEQREDIKHIQKALVDMWVLSLSDTLLTSHMSTFGYTAQGLAGIMPYYLKPWLDLPCWRSVSSNPCFHFAPQQVHCLADNFTMKDPLLQTSYIMKCPDLPDTGLQLAEL